MLRTQFQERFYKLRHRLLDEASRVFETKSGARIGLVALGPRRNGANYTLEDLETLQQIATHVTRVIALMGRRDGVRQ